MKEFVEKLIERLEENGQKMCEAKSSVPYGKHSPSNHRYYKAISVKKAIHIVNQLAEEYKQNIDQDLMIVESLPSLYPLQDFEVEAIHRVVERAENTNGWIPCEKELPPQPKENPLFENKPLELYLATVKDSAYPRRVFWNGKSFTDGWSEVDVLAWMELPKPYQPKGE